MSAEPVIQTQGLTKKYGNFTAVNGLDLTVHKGEVFGLLGPNGSGKTTTILMLLGLTEPTAGTVCVLGLDPARRPLSVKARVGYIPDQVGFYDDMTAYENLLYIARLNGIPSRETPSRLEETLQRVGLLEVAHKRVGAFSRGMRQRLGLADVLIKRPELVIMDEPTQGLDPEVAAQFLEMIRGLKRDGITVLLSSHQLHQVQAVCDRVGLFHRGRMALEGTVPELARRVLGGAYRIRVQAEGPRQALEEALRGLPEALHVRSLNGHGYEIESSRDIRPQVAEAIVRAGGHLFALDVQTQSLDDIYTHYFEEVKHASA